MTTATVAARGPENPRRPQNASGPEAAETRDRSLSAASQRGRGVFGARSIRLRGRNQEAVRTEAEDRPAEPAPTTPTTPTTPPAPPETREQVIGAGVQWLFHWTLRWFVIALGAFLVGWGIERSWSILLPVLLALILATVLEGPTTVLHRLGLPRGVAAFAVIVASFGLVAAAVRFLAPSAGTQALQIADRASAGLTQVGVWVRDSDLDITEAQVTSVVGAAQSQLQDSASSIASGLLVGVGALTSALITVVLTVVLTFFLLKDGKRFLPWLERVGGPRVGAHLHEVGTRAWAALGGFVHTQALVGLIDALLIGLGLVLLGVPLAVPLAALTFVAAFAPIIGAVAVGGLAVLVALVTQGWGTAVAVLVIVLLVQQLEGNVFLPWLQGRKLHLHAAIVLLTIVLGSTLFGVAGAFLSVPVVAVAAVMLRYLDEQIEARVSTSAGARSQCR